MNEEKIIVFGSGKKAKSTIEMIKSAGGLKIVKIWDNNNSKWGKKFMGYDISAPEKDIPGISKIIIASVFYNEISIQLKEKFSIESDKIADCKYALHDVEKRIIAKYEKTMDKEILDILERIKKEGLETFNYEFINKYKNKKYIIDYDKSKKMFFAIWKGKKMYFSRKFQEEFAIENYLRNIDMEQDMESPHKYLFGDYQIKNNDVIIDAGAAEGFFTLEVIDKIKKAYLIETDSDWVDALHETFKDYGEKVVIIEKFLSSNKHGKNITIDEFFSDREINFIKMDIEGEELNALEGAEETLKRNKDLSVVACTYHQKNDAEDIEKFIKKMNYQTEFSKGYMFFGWNKKVQAEFRKGVIRAKNKTE